MNFITILNALIEQEFEFVIVGGVAARLHGSTRLTHDLDIVPKLDESSWKNLIQSIWALNTRPRIPSLFYSLKPFPKRKFKVINYAINI